MQKATLTSYRGFSKALVLAPKTVKVEVKIVKAEVKPKAAAPLTPQFAVKAGRGLTQRGGCKGARYKHAWERQRLSNSPALRRIRRIMEGSMLPSQALAQAFGGPFLAVATRRSSPQSETGGYLLSGHKRYDKSSKADQGLLLPDMDDYLFAPASGC